MGEMKRRMSAIELLVCVLSVAILGFIIYLIRDTSERLGPKEFTALKMGRIAGRILDFYSLEGEWPTSDSWEEQLREYFEKERQFTPEELVTDAWGGKIEYQVVTNRAGDVIKILRSFGPDKTQSTKDDITLELEVPKKKSPSQPL
jgi:hypothetical protein